MEKDIRFFLEEEHRLHFYDLLGGLADNLLTLGKFAGTFTSCDACGNTITLKERSWICECCGEEFNLHFSTLTEIKGIKEAKVKVRGIRKSKLQPHWYFADENWSVGEFINLISKFPAEDFLAGWLKYLGVRIENSDICNVLCWARMKFGNKTIQPDLIIEFKEDIIIFEFKRPEGGEVPPREIMGQIVFINNATKVLGKNWQLVIVPGPNFTVKSSNEYGEEALKAIREVESNWSLPKSIIDEAQTLALDGIINSLSAIGWENLIDSTIEFIVKNQKKSWTSNQVIEKLQYFKSSRKKLGLFP